MSPDKKPRDDLEDALRRPDAARQGLRRIVEVMQRRAPEAQSSHEDAMWIYAGAISVARRALEESE